MNMENQNASMENDTFYSNNTDFDIDIINVDSRFWESHLGFALFKYVSPIIAIVGILGNIISFIVFNAKAMNGSVCSIFFRVLAIADTLFLCAYLPMWFTEAFYHYTLMDSNIVVCKVYPFVLCWTKDMSGWILSAVAVERAIGVSMPHHYKCLVTRKRACTLLAAIILTLLIINSYSMIFYRFISDIENGTSVSCDLSDFHKSIWHYGDLVVYCICPFTIICSSNVCVIYFVIQASYRRRNSMTTNQSTDHSTNLSVILILVSVVYICCTLPIMLSFIIYFSWDVPNISYKKQIHLSLFFNFGVVLSLLNSAVNFVLYCLSGPRFRQELKHMFFEK